jgi:molybdopterin converting factor small subunit
MAVHVLLPGALAELVGGTRRLDVEVAEPATIATLFEVFADAHPVLHRRLCDETGSLRRYVNVYVDGDDVRRGAGLQTAVPDGATVQILPSVAGGALPAQ